MKNIFKTLLAAAIFFACGTPSADTAFQTYYPPAYTWATKPTCTTAISGMEVRVTNVGPSDWVALCDGTSWTAQTILLENTGVVKSTTGDTNENKVHSVLVPAGILGANGCLDIDIQASASDNTNTKAWRVYLHTSDAVGGTNYFGVTATTTSNDIMRAHRQICNRNNASAQGVGISAGTGNSFAAGASDTTSAINTGSDAYVIFTGQNTTSGADTTSFTHIKVIATPSP